MIFKNNYKYSLGRFLFLRRSKCLMAFSANSDNPLCTLGVGIFSLFHPSKRQMTLMESHIFSLFVTYLVSPACNEKHLLLSLENTTMAAFVFLFITCILMFLKTLIPISSSFKYGYYVVLQQILRKYCFLVWLWWHLFHGRPLERRMDQCCPLNFN